MLVIVIIDCSGSRWKALFCDVNVLWWSENRVKGCGELCLGFLRNVVLYVVNGDGGDEKLDGGANGN